eukprot:2155911-Pleurochrysis_carterae.AAC.1
MPTPVSPSSRNCDLSGSTASWRSSITAFSVTLNTILVIAFALYGAHLSFDSGASAERLRMRSGAFAVHAYNVCVDVSAHIIVVTVTCCLAVLIHPVLDAIFNLRRAPPRGSCQMTPERIALSSTPLLSPLPLTPRCVRLRTCWQRPASALYF